jgi:hypothetical protein
MLTLTLRHRREDVGVREETNRPDPTYMGPCADCDVDSIVPYSYRSNSIGLRASSPFGRRVRLGLSGRAEDRPYALPSYLEGRRPGEAPRAWDFRRRHDRRYTAGGDFSVRITDAISVVLRYSAALSQSNVRGGWRDRCEDFAVCHPLDFDDRNYVKHLASLELEASWF